MDEITNIRFSSSIAKRRSWDARYGVYIFILGAAIVTAIFGQ